MSSKEFNVVPSLRELGFVQQEHLSFVAIGKPIHIFVWSWESGSGLHGQSVLTKQAQISDTFLWLFDPRSNVVIFQIKSIRRITRFDQVATI